MARAHNSRHKYTSFEIASGATVVIAQSNPNRLGILAKNYSNFDLNIVIDGVVTNFLLEGGGGDLSGFDVGASNEIALFNPHTQTITIPVLEA